MARSIFVDITDSEVITCFFEPGRIDQIKRYPLKGRYDFPLDVVPGDVEKAYLSLPLSLLNFRLLELPFSDRDRIREILPFELDGVVLGGAGNVVFDSVIIGPSGDKFQVLAVYIEKASIKKLLDKLKSYGIDPVLVMSLELRTAVRDFVPANLLSPPELKDEDRMNLAREEMKSPSVNLRRDEFAYTRDIEETRKSLRITAVLVFLIALILSGDALFKIVATRAEISMIKNDLRKEYQEMFPSEKNIVNELYQLKAHMKELKGKESTLVGASPLALLDRLSRTDRQGAVINEISIDKTSIVLKGETQSLSDVQQFQSKLKGEFNDVGISDSKSSAQGRILFTLTAKEKKP